MRDSGPPPEAQPRASPLQATTASILARAQAGDSGAQGLLYRRFQPRLIRWASGRLPPYARGLLETGDLVQIAFQRALTNLKGFENRRPGAFLAYLREILGNVIRDEIRQARRRPAPRELSEEVAEDKPSPLEEAIGSEAWARYEEALRRLSQDQREAVILRIELGLSYREIAEIQELDKPNTARMRVARGLAKVAEMLDES